MGEEDYSYADRSDDEDVDLLRSHWFIVISIGNRLLRQGEDPGILRVILTIVAVIALIYGVILGYISIF